MSEVKRNWYAVYTKPRWEKRVVTILEQKGLEAYCPLNKVQRMWSDRKKWILEPLFKSYLFVRITEEEKSLVRMVDGIVNFVYWLGKPAIVKDREIEVIRRFLTEHTNVRAEPIDLQRGSEVWIRRGVLMDKEATVLGVYNNKVKVVIESIGYSLVAILDKSSVDTKSKQPIE